MTINMHSGDSIFRPFLFITYMRAASHQHSLDGRGLPGARRVRWPLQCPQTDAWTRPRRQGIPVIPDVG